MSKKILKATHEDRPLKIGNMEIPCAVLEDGTRVLTQQGVRRALGRGAGKTGSGELPSFLNPNNLQRFVDADLMNLVKEPIHYIPKIGRGRANGVPAILLPKICEVWLKARDAGVLSSTQMGAAQQADVLMRGFAHVGVIALVDEATGYQDVRVKDALETILAQFLLEEAKKYKVTFPLEFYRMIFKLNGWAWTPQSAQKKPQVVARWTNDLVYSRLAPGLLEALEIKNPKENGKRKRKHFQFLTDEIGEPRLLEHFGGLIALGRVAPNWRKFKELVERAFPKNGENLVLPLGFDGE